RVDLLTVGRDDVRADRQEVAREVLADAGLLGLVRLRILDADPRTGARVTRLDDHAPRQTGDLVELLLHGDAVDDVAVADHAGDVGKDRDGVGVPLGEERLLLDPVAVLHLEEGAVHEVVLLLLAARLIHDLQYAVAVHHHHVPVLPLDELDVLELDPTLEAVLEARLLDLAARRCTTDVEGPHRELRARLTDGLGCDHADRFTHVHLVAAREVAPVAQRADPAPVLAGQDRADDHLLDPGLLDGRHLVLVDLLAGPNDDRL